MENSKTIMENQNTNKMTNYTADELWDMGREFSLEDIIWYMEFPESWTQEMIDEYSETYEVIDCTEDEEEQTIYVEVEGMVDGQTLRANCTFEDDKWGMINLERSLKIN